MEFYVLKNSEAVNQKTTEYFSVRRKYGQAPRCSSCGEYIGSLEWLPPYEAEIKLWGDSFSDIAFGGESDLLVSERFRDLYEAARLTGFKGFDPVKIVKIETNRKNRGLEPPNYFHVAVVLDTASVDDRASGLVREQTPTCVECRSSGPIKFERLLLQKNSWSGTDVFYARGLPGTILVSARFAEFYKSKNIEGGMIVPAAEYRYDRDNFSWMDAYGKEEKGE